MGQLSFRDNALSSSMHCSTTKGPKLLVIYLLIPWTNSKLLYVWAFKYCPLRLNALSTPVTLLFLCLPVLFLILNFWMGNWQVIKNVTNTYIKFQKQQKQKIELRYIETLLNIFKSWKILHLKEDKHKYKLTQSTDTIGCL